MKPEILKKAIQLQKEIDELEEIRDCGIRYLVKHILSGKCAEYRSSWFSSCLLYTSKTKSIQSSYKCEC